MPKTIIRYMYLAGEVWIYLQDGEIRKATGSEISRIITQDPEFGLHFASQTVEEPPMLRHNSIPLGDPEVPH